MNITAKPINEQARLEELYSYQVLDTGMESTFDELVELASEIAGMPISLISLVDSERQWFKARKGLDTPETPREVSFCAHAIQTPKPFIIPDATKDRRFATNPLVTSGPNIRFYGGFPLVAENGYRLGTLCVIDNQPNDLNADQVNKLQKLANQAMKLLELHRANRLMQQVRDAEQQHKEKLERLVESQRKIITILAHDTRAPLYALKELTKMFLEGAVPPDQAHDIYAMMFDQTKVTITMIEELIEWGKLYLNMDEEEKAPMHIREMVLDIFRQYKPQASAKHIDLFEEISDPPPLRANPSMIAFILRNLVNNSVKYTENGSIKVVGRIEENRYTIAVSDTGIGMPDSIKKALFRDNPVSQAGTRKEQGSGLGLMLINDFVRQVGGTITVQSELTKGTTIRVAIPSL